MPLDIGASSPNVYYLTHTSYGKSDVSTLNIRSYNISRRFYLLPKSIKIYPFFTSKISLKYTLEASIYLPSMTQIGLFRRNTFTIQVSEE